MVAREKPLFQVYHSFTNNVVESRIVVHHYDLKVFDQRYLGFELKIAVGKTFSFKKTIVTVEAFSVNSFTPAKSKTDKFYKITNWVKLKNKQHHSKVLHNSFPMIGHTSGFCP